MSKILFFTLGLWLGLLLAVSAQDIHFTQQYANRLSLNPAFAGIRSDFSVTAAYRQQWPSAAGAFITNQVSGDYRFFEQKSALGLVASYDKAGPAGLVNMQASGIYTYHSQINEDLAFSAGLQATYGSRKIDYGSLTFGDQLSETGATGNPTAEIPIYDPVSYLSFGTGGIIYNNNFWAGLALYNLNQPDLGFATPSKLPLKAVVNAGFKYFLLSYTSQNKPYEFSLTPTVTFTKQGPHAKTDVGLYTTYTPLTLGIIYRGLPLLSTNEHESTLAILTGIELNQLQLCYSYDIGLNGFSNRMGGAHEFTVAFEQVDLNRILRKKNSDKNYKRIACPAF